MTQAFTWAVTDGVTKDLFPRQREPIWSELLAEPSEIIWTKVDPDPDELDDLGDLDDLLTDAGAAGSGTAGSGTGDPGTGDPGAVTTAGSRQSVTNAAPSVDFAAGVAAAFAVTKSALALVQISADRTSIMSVNPAFSALTGWAAAELLDGLAQGRSVTSALLCQRSDGTPYWAEVSIAPIGLGTGGTGTHAPQLAMVEQRDLSKQLAAEADTWRARHVDPITGSAARTLADEAIMGHVVTGRPFGVLLIRVEGVERLNAEGGYAEGDVALAATAERLAAALAGRGRVARHVGTHFIVIVDNLGADGRGLTHTLADELEVAARVDGLGAFAGTALFPVDATTPAELLDLAREQLETVRRQSRTRLGRLVWRLQWMLHRK
jgi:GGDEF domain-containing protein